MERGPVGVMNMYVFADLLSYASGVYEHRWGEYLAAHDVKLIGWGVDTSGPNGQEIPFWTCANRYYI